MSHHHFRVHCAPVFSSSTFQLVFQLLPFQMRTHQPGCCLVGQLLQRIVERKRLAVMNLSRQDPIWVRSAAASCVVCALELVMHAATCAMCARKELAFSCCCWLEREVLFARQSRHMMKERLLRWHACHDMLMCRVVRAIQHSHDSTKRSEQPADGQALVRRGDPDGWARRVVEVKLLQVILHVHGTVIMSSSLHMLAVCLWWS